MLQDKVNVRVRPAPVEPSLHPLIDAGLILFIVYLVAATLGRAAPQRPAPHSAPPSSVASQVVVDLSERGLEINGEAVPRADLEPALRSIYARRSSRILFLRVAPAMGPEETMRLVDVAKRSGVHLVAVVPPGGGAAGAP